MEPEHNVDEKLDVRANNVEPVKPAPPFVEPVKSAKNPKRVAAGKKLTEHNKKAKEKMLEDIAEANANASKANSNSDEAVNALNNYLKQSVKPSNSLQEYQTPIIIISGALLLAGLYLWSSKLQSADQLSAPPQPAQPSPPRPEAVNDNDMFTI